jgi:hypothetical protein
MAGVFDRPHLGSIENFASGHDYTYPRKLKIEFPVVQRIRGAHGGRLLNKLQSIRQQFELAEHVELPESIVRDDALYVTFISEWGYELKFEQLNQNKDRPDYQIVNVRQEVHPDRESQIRYHVAVMLTKGGVSHFIKRVQTYLDENTKDRDGNETDTPKANPLVANISNIQLATLEAFWSDGPEIPFPESDTEVWWEVWFRKLGVAEDKMSQVEQNLESIGAQIGNLQLEFPEHLVRLVKATPQQLSSSLMLLDNLAELRKPQQIADFLVQSESSIAEREAWLEDFMQRVSKESTDRSVLVCLLDSGVNNKHQLLSDFLPDSNLYTWNDGWGKYDGEGGGGHGTGMAGLSLYGDLHDSLSGVGEVKVYHRLESFKIYNAQSPNDPELYGAIYIYACSSPIADRPDPLRVFCLSVTNKDFVFDGRPSSSSASIDRIACGNFLDPSEPQLVLVSGGNVRVDRSDEYPNKNFTESIQDPGQAYNALTVGSYTRKDRIDLDSFPGRTPLAEYGGMAPSNSTSATWELQWPNKPDIVMEGGNLADNNGEAEYFESLQLLTTDKRHGTHIFQPFRDTSAATALASKMAAELRAAYPHYWPETIRALMVHSATWTEAMLQTHNLDVEGDRRALIRSVGYGVPNLQKAMYSAKHSLTLVAENDIVPYRKEGSSVRYNQYHLYELPWPVEVLRDIVGAGDATLTVTLSYFIEPSPGNRQYATNFRYHSHELDFKLIKPTETAGEFQRRISAASLGTEESSDESVSTSSEDWTLRERIRSKGSIKKDFITVSGVELSRRNLLAIYPKNGWYRSRPKLDKVDSTVRYSLVVSIETASQEVDIYTPVMNHIQNQIPVEINV